MEKHCRAMSCALSLLVACYLTAAHACDGRLRDVKCTHSIQQSTTGTAMIDIADIENPTVTIAMLKWKSNVKPQPKCLHILFSAHHGKSRVMQHKPPCTGRITPHKNGSYPTVHLREGMSP